ncbi:MAG: carboxypeptidase [Fimbriimonadaceae bacterium]|nr:carboxypeptidase [Fimbriimonadaceae bacterium]
MVEIAFNRYYRYDDFSKLLHDFAKEFPSLVEVESIGKSYEGKDIWLLTVTNSETGPAEDKPAFWCDGNIHATEVSAGTAILHLLNKLCTGFGKDEQITHVLNSRAFYLVPRLNPDGAEWALEDVPRMIRSSTRPYPFNEEDLYGLERKDINGDGKLLNIRIKDANGPWKVSEREPRLMEKRQPNDVGGTYYRVIPEGLFHNYDGLTMRGRKVKQGLDMNRNFPAAWRQEHEQYGAGPYPTSEPEIRAAVQAIFDRPNICGAITFHTYSGVFLRPPCRYPDDDMPAEDLWVYKDFGVKCQEITGYPAISNFHEFKYHPKEVITGTFDDWMFEHRGVHAWTCEIWAPQRQAGITDYKYIDWGRDHPFEDDLKMLKWSDEKLDGQGYHDWKPFTHPQLGEVEIGGWDAFNAFRNPPPKFLEKEIAPLGDFAIWQASASPKLELKEVQTAAVGSSIRIRMAVINSGYLPTTVTKHADMKKLVRGVVGEISRNGEPTHGAGSTEPEWLASGRLRQDAGQLSGWSHVGKGGFGYQFDGTDNMAVFEWVVSGPGEYHLVAKHERAGTVRVTLRI